MGIFYTVIDYIYGYNYGCIGAIEMKKYLVCVDGHIYLEKTIVAESIDDALNKAHTLANNVDEFIQPNVIWVDGHFTVNGILKQGI